MPRKDLFGHPVPPCKAYAVETLLENYEGWRPEMKKHEMELPDQHLTAMQSALEAGPNFWIVAAKNKRDAIKAVAQELFDEGCGDFIEDIVRDICHAYRTPRRDNRVAHLYDPVVILGYFTEDWDGFRPPGRKRSRAGAHHEQN